jgi:hypothetical protein
MYLEDNIEEEISLISFFNFSAKGMERQKERKNFGNHEKKILGFSIAVILNPNK